MFGYEDISLVNVFFIEVSDDIESLVVLILSSFSGSIFSGVKNVGMMILLVYGIFYDGIWW